MRRGPRPLLRRAWHSRFFEIGSLVLLVLVVGGVWAFLGLLDEVNEGETEGFDQAILLGLRTAGDLSDPVGPLWFEEFMRDVSGFGGVGMMTLMVAATTVFLALIRKVRAAVFFAISVGSGGLVSSLFKHFVDRPRPDLVPQGSYVHTASFPSGHSMMSAVVYLILAVMLARTQTSCVVRVYLMVLAVLLTLGIGVSRVYLGVHWPTDVLAGWALGAAWALMCALLARYLGQRGEIEPDAREDPGRSSETAPRP